MRLLDIFSPDVRETTFVRESDGMTVTIFPPDGYSAEAYRARLLEGGVDAGDISAILNRHANMSTEGDARAKELSERKASCPVRTSSLDCEC